MRFHPGRASIRCTAIGVAACILAVWLSTRRYGDSPLMQGSSPPVSSIDLPLKSSASPQVAEGPADLMRGVPRPGHTYFFSIGDFGVAGCAIAFAEGERDFAGGRGHRGCRSDVQRLVAEEMARLAEGLRPSFVLSLGDNFYIRGVTSLEDRQINQSFEHMYERGSLAGVPWRIALGDHDHRGNVSALIMHTSRSSRWKLPSPFYSFRHAVDGGTGDCSAVTCREVEILVTDSVGLEGAVEPHLLQDRRFKEDLSEQYAGKRTGTEQWTWLENAFASCEDPTGASNATTPRGQVWAAPALRIVVGHRPVVSAVNRSRQASELSVSNRMRNLLERASPSCPILYLSGHDHAMQYSARTEAGLHFAGSGTGGFSYHALLAADKRPSEFKWGAGKVPGFVLHELSVNSMNLHFVDAQRRAILHSVSIPFSKVVQQRPIGPDLRV
eukprot:gnl/TRDRNA2_/TRDRNA2_156559_c0_seq1.p1 gnl/TRDRNA2_/TRDRNA2_156559_c0~~gnl/TRDRNA2_/TRDRNA2_156559_c0_seq1.p1  ORF type:complete len:441 (+),score=43.88 gnl/TRDRNA2_/TRDRNA2_156559_c0_seq1:62-1384(+)